MKSMPILIFCCIALCWDCSKAPKTPDSVKLSSEEIKKMVKSEYLNPDTPYTYKHPGLAKGDWFDNLDRYISAKDAYLAASDSLRKAEDWEGSAWALIRACTMYQFTDSLDGEWMNAKPFIDQLVKIFPKQLKGGENHPFIAIAYYFKGLYHLRNFDADSAKYSAIKSIDLMEQYFNKPSFYIARDYFLLSKIMIDFYADVPSSQKNHEIGIKILSKCKDGHSHAYNAAQSIYHLAERFRALKNFDKSNSYAYEILPYLDSLNPGTTWRYGLSTYTIMGQNLMDKNLYDRALEKLNQGERKYEYLYSLLYENYEYQYYYLENQLRISEVNSYLGKYSEAITNLGKIIGRLASLKEPTSELEEIKAEAHRILGKTLIKMNDFEKAQLQLEKALAVYNDFKAPFIMEKAGTLTNLGDIAMKKLEPIKALGYYQRAISRLTNISKNSINELPKTDATWNQAFLMEIAQKKGEAFLKSFEKDSENLESLKLAFNHFKRAIDLKEKAFISVDRVSDQNQFTHLNYTLFEQTLNCLYLLDSLTNKKQYANMSIEVLELSKARSLYRQILEADLLHNVYFANKNIFKEYYALKQETSYLQQKIKENEISLQASEEVLENYHNKLIQIETKLEIAQKRLSTTLFDEESSAQVGSFNYCKSIRRLGFNGAISFFWGKRYCFTAGFSKRGASLHRHLLTKKDSANVDTLALLLNQKRNKNTEILDYAKYCKAARALYRTFVEPVNEHFQVEDSTEVKNLLILPDGLLFLVPFETFLTETPSQSYVTYKKLKYFIRDVNISYGLSLNVLLHNKKKANPLQSPKVLAFNYDTTTQSKSSNNNVGNRSGWAFLPGTTKEVKAIDSLFSTKLAPNDASQKKYFLKHASSYDILLLSIHGELDSQFQSKLIFFNRDSVDRGEPLYPYEVLGLPLHLRLAILSACESGVGKHITGEGMNSIARAFIEAGCPSMLMSLWKLPDGNTSEVMIPFFKNLKNAQPMNSSLREAKIRFIDNSDYLKAHPSHWAGMILMGNNNPLVYSSDSKSKFIYFFQNNLWIFLALVIILAFWKLMGMKKN